MNDDKLRQVKTVIKKLCSDENEITLTYDIDVNQFRILNEYIQIKLYDKFSLTNFYKILSMIKNDDEFIYKHKIKEIIVYP